MHVQEMEDEHLMAIARIMGSASAASRAIAERDRRRASGESAVVLWDRDNGRLLVGPPVEEPR